MNAYLFMTWLLMICGIVLVVLGSLYLLTTSEYNYLAAILVSTGILLLCFAIICAVLYRQDAGYANDETAELNAMIETRETIARMEGELSTNIELNEYIAQVQKGLEEFTVT